MVNILDVDPSDLYAVYGKLDKLQALFKLIEDFGMLYDMKFPDNQHALHSREHQRLVREVANSGVEEVYEALNCLKNKPWNRRDIQTDLQHYNDELADSVIFFIQWLRISGLTADKIFDLVLRKMKVNEFRIASGYMDLEA